MCCMAKEFMTWWTVAVLRYQKRVDVAVLGGTTSLQPTRNQPFAIVRSWPVCDQIASNPLLDAPRLLSVR